MREGVMRRDHYAIFSKGKIGPLTVPNRLVRSATWDPSILGERKMTSEVVNLYRTLALGGIGLIITGDFSVVPQGMLEKETKDKKICSYEDMRIRGFSRLVEAVKSVNSECKIVAQLSGEYFGVGPSDVPSPFRKNKLRPLSSKEVRFIVDCFVESIAGVKGDGFEGVQLHAAHGGLLSRFLSPHTNRRNDEYGGTLGNRTRIVREIVQGARERIGDYPILVKMNCTDFVEGGINIDNFPGLAREIQRCGVDGIEVSGGMKDCLTKTSQELGFRPVPSPESHTHIAKVEQQSYFLKYVEGLILDIPIILVGGNRDIEQLEEIVQQKMVDFISLCRPLISEPDLPMRWMEGRGGSTADCISCNSCIYDMRVRIEKGENWVATCLVKNDRTRVKMAQQWLSAWVGKNIVTQVHSEK
jgi:2,4-dienoyl-CoA reductase-like NADH-dependent reductase (Old Yellow Enzyme family)